ncbi:hypothetical protein ACNFU2_06950 [Chryseobacterium sp. PTM-20240506]|uniref:hypothetical protein n=1 Tax=Chryseobacterium sp. PTM-20240506 TaxID=3400631 RepID=UPI003AB03AAE
MNSGENNKVELRNSSVTDLTSSQSTSMQNHTKIISENRERKEKEQQKSNQNQNGN